MPDPGRGAGAEAFRRELGLWDATMLVVGSMIGSGIFIVSADIARTVGSTGHLLLVWLIAGAITMIAALSYGELAGMMPHAGGQYVYLREAWGPLVGFLYGWTLFLVIQTGTIAAVAVAFAKFASVLEPSLGVDNVLFSLAGKPVSAAQLVAVASIAVLTAVNLRGLRGGKLIQDVFTAAKVAALAGLIAFCLWFRDADALSDNLSGFWEAATPAGPLSGWRLWSAVGVAMVGALFSSDAWNNVTFTAGEIVDPKRNIPLSLAIGTAIVTVIYLSANAAYLCVLPLGGDPAATDAIGRGIQHAAQDRVATAAVSAVLGPVGAVVMAVLIMVSTFGCNNGLILAGARVYYAMAKDKLFFRRLGTLNKRAVPGAALVLQGVWAGVLCLSGSYGDLLDYVIFAVLVFYILTVAGIFLLRRSRPNAERPYKAWLYPWMPAAYIVIASAICLDLLIFKPTYTWPGLGIVLSGIPAYFFWKKA